MIPQGHAFHTHRHLGEEERFTHGVFQDQEARDKVISFVTLGSALLLAFSFIMHSFFTLGTLPKGERSGRRMYRAGVVIISGW